MRLTTRFLLALSLLAVVACGGGQKPHDDFEDDELPDPGSASPGGVDPGEPPPPDNELERRKAAACERVIPRMTDCAVEDARKNLTAEQLAELDLEHTAPIHTREYIKKCKADRLSSRQVRVYETCADEQGSCEQLRGCLDHLKPEP